VRRAKLRHTAKASCVGLFPGSRDDGDNEKEQKKEKEGQKVAEAKGFT